MKVNRKVVTDFHKEHENIRQRRNKALRKNTENHFLISSLENGYPAYAYVPYNCSWGCVETTHEVPVEIMSNGLGVAYKEKANPELLRAIYRILGEENVKSSRHPIITFRIESRDGKFFIDETSFSFYQKKLSILTPLRAIVAELPVTLFMAPEGQQWVDEKNYIHYVSNMRNVYQCSDGTVAHSYQEFKDWECELAYHPNTPSYTSYPECHETLTSIGYLTCEDGTIWRSQKMLEEYLSWKDNKESGIKDGMYVGTYGVAPTFVDYASLYNAAYYSNAGLIRQDQFYGAYNFLYSNPNQANKSIDKLNSFQKVKK